MQTCSSRIKTAVQGVRDASSSEEDLKTMANMYSAALENEIRKDGRCDSLALFISSIAYS